MKKLFFCFILLLIVLPQNFIAQSNSEDLKVTELNYHPIEQDTIDGDDFEFIELKNCGTETIDLTGIIFTDGIEYTFESAEVEPGEFIVLAKNNEMFYDRYGFLPYDIYDGKFSNSGEKVELSSASGEIIISFEYADASPWPAKADGDGFTLVSIEKNPNTDPNDYNYWRASTDVFGSPNADDPDIEIDPIYINEILTHTDFPLVDAIEVYNPNDVSVNISGWYLTDDKTDPQKWAIPNNTVLSPGGYAVFNEGYYQFSDLVFDQNYFGSEFSLNSHGEEIYLFSANSDGYLTGYNHGFEFGECANGISFGRYITSTGKVFFPAQKSITLGYENAGPLVGPLVISEINYEPNDINYEYLKITNISDSALALFHPEALEKTWKVSGIGFKFPLDSYIASNENIYIVEDDAVIETFKLINNLGEETQVFTYPSALSNQGEKLEILRPADSFILDDSTIVPYEIIDKVSYDEDSPWPDDASGTGRSIIRIALDEYGNDPINWQSQEIVTDINDEESSSRLPTEFALEQNYPNPFNPVTAINYNIPVTVPSGVEGPLHVSLIIYDMLGKEVATLVNRQQSAGNYSVNFNAGKLTSGMYIYKIQAGEFVQSRKMLLLK